MSNENNFPTKCTIKLDNEKFWDIVNKALKECVSVEWEEKDSK